jgi:hypothetical protein
MNSFHTEGKLYENLKLTLTLTFFHGEKHIHTTGPAFAEMNNRAYNRFQNHDHTILQQKTYQSSDTLKNIMLLQWIIPNREKEDYLVKKIDADQEFRMLLPI